MKPFSSNFPPNPETNDMTKPSLDSKNPAQQSNTIPTELSK